MIKTKADDSGRIINKNEIIVGIVSVGLFASIMLHPDIVDNAVLLEKRNPDYWNLFNSGVTYEYEIPAGISPDYGTPFVFDNALDEYTLLKYEGNGIEVTTDKESIFIDGVAEEDMWLNAVEQPITLSDGIYYFSSGNNNLDCYLDAWKDDKNNILARDGDNYFFKASSKYDWYKYTIPIKSGDKYENVEITPKIIKVSDVNGGKTKIRLWSMDRNEWETLADRDRNIFLRQLNQDKSYDWSSIIFDDGTGIQYTSTESTSVINREGTCDILGRVIVEK